MTMIKNGKWWNLTFRRYDTIRTRLLDACARIQGGTRNALIKYDKKISIPFGYQDCTYYVRVSDVLLALERVVNGEIIRSVNTYKWDTKSPWEGELTPSLIKIADALYNNYRQEILLKNDPYVMSGCEIVSIDSVSHIKEIPSHRFQVTALEDINDSI